ncbi:MAG: YigZ family protein [Anaerolineae bacterium]
MKTYYRPAIGMFQRTEIEILKSRFITTIASAKTADEARAFIQSIRDEIPDASHHVYAFRAGYGNSVIEGMSDDGEPSGTAGPPTLSVLRGADLGDVALVTTRYFGGTKLGTGGLVRAYSDSAKIALNEIQTELKAPKTQVGMDLPYHLYEQVKNLITRYQGIINDEVFAGDVTIICTFCDDTLLTFRKDLLELSSGQVNYIYLSKIDA